MRVALAALFSAVLMIPLLRRLRRTAAWNWVRGLVLLAAVCFAVLEPGCVACQFAAGLAALLALILRRTPDPDAERILQRKYGADYLLNGGEWAPAGSGEEPAGLASGTPLWLLLRDPRLVVVRRDRQGEVQTAVRIDQIERILVDGRDYFPVYVSEAKQPPVRERDVDRHALCYLTLELRTGRILRFRYRGTFSRHLAEAAAHAVYSERLEGRRGSAALA